MPAGGLWLVLADPEPCCVSASHIMLRGGEAEQPHGLGGVTRHAAAAFAHHPQVILTTRIAGFRVGLSGLVCRENVAALFSGFGGSKIGSNRPDPEHEKDCNKIRHHSPRVMFAARSKLL